MVGLMAIMLVGINMVLVILNYKSKREIKVDAYSDIYGIRLGSMSIKHDYLKTEGKLKKYPKMSSYIGNIINLQHDSKIHVENLKLAKVKIFDFDSVLKTGDLIDELIECRDKEVRELFEEVSEINKQLAILVFPIKTKRNRINSSIRFWIIRVLAKTLSRFVSNIDDDIRKEAEERKENLSSKLSYT
jgi:hypothetical protein